MRNRTLPYTSEQLEEMASEHNISVPLLRVRLSRGWDLNRALNDPVRARVKRSRMDLYPNLAQWIDDHNYSLLEASECFDMDNNTLANILYGFTNPTKGTIDKILSATGMTYEECFKEA